MKFQQTTKISRSSNEDSSQDESKLNGKIIRNQMEFPKEKMLSMYVAVVDAKLFLDGCPKNCDDSVKDIFIFRDK